MTEPLKGAVSDEPDEMPERLRARLLDDDDIEYLTAGTDEEEDDEPEEDDAGDDDVS